MGLVEGLQRAFAKEEEAIQMYKEFSVTFFSARDTFIALMNEEHKHKQRIEKKITELTH